MTTARARFFVFLFWISYLISRYMRPKGPWQRQHAAAPRKQETAAFSSRYTHFLSMGAVWFEFGIFIQMLTIISAQYSKIWHSGIYYTKKKERNAFHMLCTRYASWYNLKYHSPPGSIVIIHIKRPWENTVSGISGRVTSKLWVTVITPGRMAFAGVVSFPEDTLDLLVLTVGAERGTPFSIRGIGL